MWERTKEWSAAGALNKKKKKGKFILSRLTYIRIFTFVSRRSPRLIFFQIILVRLVWRIGNMMEMRAVFCRYVRFGISHRERIKRVKRLIWKRKLKKRPWFDIPEFSIGNVRLCAPCAPLSECVCACMDYWNRAGSGAPRACLSCSNIIGIDFCSCLLCDIRSQRETGILNVYCMRYGRIRVVPHRSIKSDIIL